MSFGFWEIAGWCIPIFMLPVIASRHMPTAAIAWMLLIFFSPWAGLAIYLLFGENRVIRRLTKTYCQRIKEVRSLHNPGSLAPQFPQTLSAGTMPLELISERLACLPSVQGNRVELLGDGNEVINRLVQDITSARKHVHLLFYIFQDDVVGRRVGEAVAAAAGRGVKTRVVVDAFGSRSLAGSLGPWLQSHGVEFRALMTINPFRWHHTRLDFRNHRKLAVIDGELAYTGSQNIEAKDYDHGRAEAWHDIMVRISGPGVLQLQMVFVEDWFLATSEVLEDPGLFPEPVLSGETAVQAVPTGPTDPNTTLRDILVTAIGTARESVVITSPYFIPDETFRVALYLASLRGVQIDLLIPRHTDHMVVGAVARAYISTLAGSGINIHFHRGLLHSKTMTVDRMVSVVGTANFDRRSFFLHSELSLLLYGREITERLRAIQTEYIAQSIPIDWYRWKRRSPMKNLRDNILKILSPIL